MKIISGGYRVKKLLKKIFLLSVFGILVCAPIFGATNVFDMSELGAALDEIAYPNKNQTFQEFQTDAYARYNGFIAELIQLGQINPDLQSRVIGFNGDLVEKLSDITNLKIIYVSKLIHINQQVAYAETQSFISRIFGPPAAFGPSNIIDLSGIGRILDIQEQRESFFKILLLNPTLKAEYDEILRGQITTCSEELAAALKLSTEPKHRLFIPIFLKYFGDLIM